MEWEIPKDIQELYLKLVDEVWAKRKGENFDKKYPWYWINHSAGKWSWGISDRWHKSKQNKE